MRMRKRAIVERREKHARVRHEERGISCEGVTELLTASRSLRSCAGSVGESGDASDQHAPCFDDHGAEWRRIEHRETVRHQLTMLSLKKAADVPRHRD